MRAGIEGSPPPPALGGVLRWLLRDVGLHHGRLTAEALALGFASAGANLVGLALLADTARSLGPSGWTVRTVARLGADPVLATPLIGIVLLGSFVLSSLLAYWSGARVVDLTHAYRARCAVRVLERLGETAGVRGPWRRAAAGRVASADVMASTQALRVAVNLVTPAWMLAVSLALLMRLHPGATLLLALLAAPFAVMTLRVIAAVEEASRAADRPAAGEGLPEERHVLMLERFRFEERGRLLTDLFGALALVALLLVLAPVPSAPAAEFGILLAYVVILRQAVGSARAIFSGSASIARLAPALERHRGAAVLGVVADESPRQDED